MTCNNCLACALAPILEFGGDIFPNSTDCLCACVGNPNVNCLNCPPGNCLNVKCSSFNNGCPDCKEQTILRDFCFRNCQGENCRECTPTCDQNQRTALNFIQNWTVTPNALWSTLQGAKPLIETFIRNVNPINFVEEVLIGYAVRTTIFKYLIIFMFFFGLLLFVLFSSTLNVTTTFLLFFGVGMVLIFFAILQEEELRTFLALERRRINQQIIEVSTQLGKEIPATIGRSFVEGIRCSCLPNICCLDPNNTNKCNITFLT